MPISLFLVCDHTLFRHGVVKLLALESSVRVVGESDLTMDTAGLVGESTADVVLLAAHAPGVSCGPAAQALYRARRGAPVIVVLLESRGEEALAALRLGARGILDRHTDGARLLTSIREASAGEITIAPHVATRLVADYMAISGGQRLPPGDGALSEREIDVLTQLAHGKSNREIADSLCVSIHTVRAHLRSVMQKLGVRNRVQAAAFAVNAGIGVSLHTENATSSRKELA